MKLLSLVYLINQSAKRGADWYSLTFDEGAAEILPTAGVWIPFNTDDAVAQKVEADAAQHAAFNQLQSKNAPLRLCQIFRIGEGLRGDPASSSATCIELHDSWEHQYFRFLQLAREAIDSSAGGGTIERQSPKFKLQIIDGFFMGFSAKLRDKGVFPCCSACHRLQFFNISTG